MFNDSTESETAKVLKSETVGCFAKAQTPESHIVSGILGAWDPAPPNLFEEYLQ